MEHASKLKTGLFYVVIQVALPKDVTTKVLTSTYAPFYCPYFGIRIRSLIINIHQKRFFEVTRIQEKSSISCASSLPNVPTTRNL